MFNFRDAPISRKLSLAFIGMSVSAVSIASAVFLGYDWNAERQSMADDLTSLSAVIGKNSTAALTFIDQVTASEVLSALGARPNIEIACIYRADDAPIQVFARYLKPGVTLDCPLRTDTPGVKFSSDHMGITNHILLDGETIGSLYLRQNLDRLWNTVSLHIQVVGFVILASLGFSFLAAALMQHLITKPILNLASTAQDITETKNYGLRAPVAGKDEVGQLIRHFNSMLAEIEDRDDKVILARKQLEEQVEQTTQAYNEQRKTLQRLKETQKQLVQTEKMASLGGLVAGVAHEINTPVGVGVTAASTLKTRTKNLKNDYENDALSESGLKSYIEMATQASDILLANLSRAAELIKSFKQVAVDQTSSELREFELASYIQEILLSLRPKLKNTAYELQVDCPSGIMVNSYPGALSQVITNLIMNSLIHGFENREEGSIQIKVRQERQHIHMRYEDNGVGISEEHQARIFDPFFTTKRGLGGSGLGLHIVFNLVSHTLNGDISMQSTPGKGTSFNITFPLKEGPAHGH